MGVLAPTAGHSQRQVVRDDGSEERRRGVALGLKGCHMPKEVAHFQYHLFLGVTQLWAQLPMPLAEEYVGPQKMKPWCGNPGYNPFTRIPRRGGCGNRFGCRTR